MARLSTAPDIPWVRFCGDRINSTLTLQTEMKTQTTCFAVLAVAILTPLGMGCSKSAPTQEVRHPLNASPSIKYNLGVIEVSGHTPTRVDLGDGKECVITRSAHGEVHGSNWLEVELTIEAKDAAGNTTRVSGPRWRGGLEGSRFSMRVGDATIVLSAKNKTE